MCDRVRELLTQHEESNRLADLLEAAAPHCGCEHHSVGQGSPGPIENVERLHRIISSPRDFDPDTGTIRERPFHKAFANGLSVWRARGSTDDIAALLIESLTRRAADSPKSIKYVCEAVVAEIREVANDVGHQVFCVYDQTVQRLDPALEPVSTHASVFQRHPPQGTPDRKTLQKDLAGKLREIFERCIMDADGYRDGLCTQLNMRSQAGEFVR